MNRTAFAALAAMLVACSGDTTKTDSGGETGTSGTPTGSTTCETFYSGPVTIQTASVDCDSAAGTVTFDVQTQGWTGGGMIYEIDSADTPPWSDEHDLESYEFDQCGAYDKLGATIQTGAAVADWQRNVSTVFTCDGHYTQGVMTYAAAVNDFDGNFADCLVWGSDAQAIKDGTITGPNDPSFDTSQCVVGTTTM